MTHTSITTPPGEAVLRVSGLCAGYGSLEVLHGLDFEARAGDITVILGPNGAGKSTTMRALAGLISARGAIEFDGRDILRLGTEQRVRSGICLVPQGRGTLPDLSVEDNLRVGAYTRERGVDLAEDIRQCYETFPVLGERCDQSAGTLSGGEQQMLALGRALMSKPKLLLLDEPSMGLAPLTVKALYEQIKAINASTGTTMLLVEQNAHAAVSVASHAFVLEAGHVAAKGEAGTVLDDPAFKRAYLGV